jgi:hypothetical protein
MPGRIRYTLIQRSKIAAALGDLVSLGATPDPALIIALKKIPHYCCTPLAVLLISLDAAA